MRAAFEYARSGFSFCSYKSTESVGRCALPFAGRVQEDHGDASAAVAHSFHQFLEAGTCLRSERVACVTQIVRVDSREVLAVKAPLILVVSAGKVVGGEETLAGKGMNAGSPVVMLNRGFSNARRAGGRNPA